VRAFQITGRVAWILRNEGWGLLGGKSASQNGCTVGGERYAIDFLVQKPSGQGVDMLVNAENQNTPAWQLFPLSPNPDLSKWRAPFPMDPQRKVTRDFDGDGKADFAVYRPSEGNAYITGSTTTVYTGGLSTDVPVPADYDGDGRTDPAVFRIGTGEWLIGLSSNAATIKYQWGNAADVPVPGDYDGDGKADIAVFRPGDGTWYVVPSRTGVPYGFQWGNGADIPVPGDYDGDHKADIAVYRPANGTWYVVRSSTGAAYGMVWGIGADRPVAADYDGDGRTDIAVFRPATGIWYVVPSRTGAGYAVAWGNGADIPVAADYDGDGKNRHRRLPPGKWHLVHHQFEHRRGQGFPVGQQPGQPDPGALRN
jgi:hypothetical protein